MNDLLVGCRVSSYPSNDVNDGDGDDDDDDATTAQQLSINQKRCQNERRRRVSPNLTRNRTWPKRRKRSRKRKNLGLKRAISQIELTDDNWNAVYRRCNHDFDYVFEKNNNYNLTTTITNHRSEYGKKSTEPVDEVEDAVNGICNGSETKDLGINFSNDVTTSRTSRFLSDEEIFDKNKLDVIQFLKSWKLVENCHDKDGQDISVPVSDTRSSISSITTLNESDSVGSFSDNASFTTGKISKHSEYQDIVISSSHLIQLSRPENLPPKPVSEQRKHQKEYEKMVEERKKKERENDLIVKKRQENRLKDEERMTQATHIWLNEILPNWSQMKNAKKTQNLWWNGLPPCVRGKVWSLSVGNALNITKERYHECLEKSKEILKTGSKDFLQMTESYEHSVELIRLDISRTFPHLCIFQRGGPYYDFLHNLLGAYVCYQPEIGYVQGMSFIAAVLLLNMEELDAFVCFANLLNKPCHKAFYSLDVQKMRIYYSAYTDLLRINVYNLYKHVTETSLTPDLYLVDWVYTLFSKSMNLDLACRVWDLILRDGESFIFRAALGIMHLSKNELLKMDFLRGAQYLTKLPEDMSPERLFKSISAIRMNNGIYSFDDLLQYYAELVC